ncbi:MAG TPA: hypothetical protein VFG48_09965, partial [Xanthomonadales bacterium]|nr:hypothetical protein [Xanthomonadales bacterium]
FAGLFLFSALAHGLLAMLILWRSLQRAPDAVEHHTEFSDALTSALTASQVYPRDQAERRAAGDALGGG